MNIQTLSTVRLHEYVCCHSCLPDSDTEIMTTYNLAGDKKTLSWLQFLYCEQVSHHIKGDWRVTPTWLASEARGPLSVIQESPFTICRPAPVSLNYRKQVPGVQYSWSASWRHLAATWRDIRWRNPRCRSCNWLIRLSLPVYFWCRRPRSLS